MYKRQASGTMAYQGGKEPAAAFWDLTAGYDNPLHLIMWYLSLIHISEPPRPY